MRRRCGELWRIRKDLASALPPCVQGHTSTYRSLQSIIFSKGCGVRCARATAKDRTFAHEKPEATIGGGSRLSGPIFVARAVRLLQHADAAAAHDLVVQGHGALYDLGVRRAIRLMSDVLNATKRYRRQSVVLLC